MVRSAVLSCNHKVFSSRIQHKEIKLTKLFYICKIIRNTSLKNKNFTLNDERREIKLDHFYYFIKIAQ